MGFGKCAVCRGKANHAVAHAGVGYCDGHFLRYVEKKIKLGAREIGIFEAKKLGVLIACDAGSSAVHSIMKEIAEERGTGIVEIRTKKEKLSPKEIAGIAKKNSVNVVITGHSVEDFILEMLLLASSKKTSKLLKLEPKTGIWGKISGVSFPAPAFRVYRHELEEYAKLKGLRFKAPGKRTELESGFSSFIERLETQHPGTKHKMLKSLLFFSQLSGRNSVLR